MTINTVLLSSFIGSGRDEKDESNEPNEIIPEVETISIENFLLYILQFLSCTTTTFPVFFSRKGLIEPDVNDDD